MNAGFPVSRRQAMHSLGAGFGSLVLADLLGAEETGAGTAARPRFAPRARSVIFLFMTGGPSHLDLFDPKPLIKKFEGQRPAEVDLRTDVLPHFADGAAQAARAAIRRR